MKGNDSMLKKGRQVYFDKLKQRYDQATKNEKQVILDEFTKTTDYTRKHAIHLLRGRINTNKVKFIILEEKYTGWLTQSFSLKFADY
ncbi:MAG: hypothetical protein COX78_03460 [Candidatus Levybacteria bacterium CG_4_10_14_0_2_um_filter_35_8]|nr:MAG: hypothetical protein COX78_03460 [Candidatus Levybacteria bacterium CG_4_10_14_0_2_um_filter_35_8]PJC54452.1 MAG: hypothetical protein CO028_02425 [Candidatus Levybacteria bacterium CG_4_9_14_0_2_um_filter_35_21]